MIDIPPETLRRLGYRAVDLVVEHLESRVHAPVRAPVPDQVRQALMNAPLPRAASDPRALIDEVAAILQYPLGNGSPRFFGWVNSPPAPIAVLGELLAAALDPSVAGGDHAATYVEHAVLKWMREMIGASPSAGGILTSGGSVANLIGLAVMRHVKTDGAARTRGLAGGDARLVVYTSTEGHSCVQKAVELLGIGSQHLRRVPVTSEWSMDLGALQRQIARDRADGLTPACVAATAGTVNTGAIDPLDEVASLCQREDLWFHVDGAYGGPAALVPDLAPRYRALGRADSIAVDPHKWLYIPVECGCALVRDVAAMRDAFSLVPPYLRDDTALPWFSEFGIQQSRGFRALKLWLALKHIGVDGYRDSISRDIALARTLQQRVGEARDFELVAAGPLSITCFRYRPPDGPTDGAELDALNRRVLDRVQAAGEAFLTGTELAGRFVLRACIVNFRTEESDLDRLIAALRTEGRALVNARHITPLI
jgi:glutamate/tyrosine decarboxylase-like PLP-dependent enzyme